MVKGIIALWGEVLGQFLMETLTPNHIRVWVNLSRTPWTLTGQGHWGPGLVGQDPPGRGPIGWIFFGSG